MNNLVNVSSQTKQLNDVSNRIITIDDVNV